ncbi:MAG: U32 family peptidase [Syntrophomonadaceae bacterium]|nr:U32 family peptidase [Syntrophomonadaceae bacterium]
MNTSNLELLAPAGNWEAMQTVINAGADAVYAGGKRFNMRLLRKDYNFSDEELKNAVDYLHERGKKFYITLNNLYFDYELAELADHLYFLQGIEVDALIIQDLGLVDIYNEMGLSVPLHASVQMGTGSLQAVQRLEDLGFKRVILSKNLSLHEIAYIHEHTSLGIEYFAHGDLCISHTGQCYFSSLLVGESGNRGRCIKPCRWKYRLSGDHDRIDDFQYHLAHKDLLLYPHVADMVHAGISSFKIEGRMRPAKHLYPLVSVYRRALDAVIEEPELFQLDSSDYDILMENRIRDFTNGSLYCRIDSDSIGFDGAREPKFPTSPKKLLALKENDYQNYSGENNFEVELTVKVGTLESLKSILHEKVERVILGLDDFRQISDTWNQDKLVVAIGLCKDNGIKAIIETPRIVMQNDMQNLIHALDNLPIELLEGIMVNDLGSWHHCINNNYPVLGGPGLNITNSRAGVLLNQNGVNMITISMENNFSDTINILSENYPTEMMIHGPLCLLITDYCAACGARGEDFNNCGHYCLQEYDLTDELNNQYRIRSDINCRNYIYHPYDLCLFNYLPLLARAGVSSLRIEGQFYTPELLSQVVSIYAAGLQSLNNNTWNQLSNFQKLLELFPQGLTTANFTGNYRE